ncbi:MAG: rRNA maturation RNAse YbeY, partial [Lentisphaeria bacterium]
MKESQQMIIAFHNLESNLQILNTNKLHEILNKAIIFITNDYKINPSHLLNIYFMNEHEMAEINEEFINHEGTTDVITFDYRDELYDE